MMIFVKFIFVYLAFKIDLSKIFYKCINLYIIFIYFELMFLIFIYNLYKSFQKNCYIAKYFVFEKYSIF